MTSSRSKAPPDTTSANDASPAPRTAVSVAVMRDGKVLLVMRGRGGSSGRWAFPGGKVEAGETLERAANRELMEETGVRAGLCGVLGTYLIAARSEPYHLTVFRADYVGGVAVAGDDAAAVRWITPQDGQALMLAEHMSDALGRL